jgi:thiamine kinase
MSENLNAFEAVALVPGWDPADFDIEELKGGLTNRTYHLQKGNDHYVLRLNAAQSAFFQFDRSTEIKILREASETGLAPRMIHADSEHGILVLEFLRGRAWQENDIKQDKNLAALAELLRRVHALPKCGNRINCSTVAATYEDYVKKRHGLHAFAMQCVEIIASIAVSDEAVCCHNDIVAANVIEQSGLRLIDWEYACDNDPLFDLASAIGFHNLEERSAAVLLDAYAGGANAELKERLADQVRLYDAIQWLWLASRHLTFPSVAQSRRLEALQQRIR